MIRINVDMLHGEAHYVLGIDAGATKTVGLLADSKGLAVVRAEAGSGCYTNIGISSMQETIRQIVSGVMGDQPKPLAVACLGMAGVDTPADGRKVREALADIVVAEQLIICNDSYTALRAGTEQPFGIVVNAGTGSIAFGINRRGEEMRAGGWGFYLSDEGSGHFIGLEALRSVFRTADGRAGADLLSAYVLSQLQVATLDELYEFVYQGGLKDDISRVAALAPLVELAAERGGREALRILRLAGRELARLAEAVIDGLQMREESFDLVLAGSVFCTRVGLRSEFYRKVRKVAPQARFRRLQQEPVWGAVRRALEMLPIPVAG